MDVLSLLQSKNRCLERYLGMSESFLKLADGGDLSGLAGFQERRDAVLKALDLYDRKISEVVALLPPGARTKTLVEQVRAALARKDELVHSILSVDLRIIGKIEDAKNELLRDLASSRKSKDTLAKFKSTWMPESGEELDRTL